MSRRVYSINFENVSVTALQDLVEINPADDHPVKILGLFLSQSSEIGDAQEEMLRIQILRGYTVSGSGGSAQTPVPIDPGDVAASFTAEVNNTTVANTGSPVILHSESFNVRSGLAHYWTPETALIANQAGTTIAIRLLANPADSVTMNGTVYVEEM